MNLENLKLQSKIASLRAEAYKKLAMAEEMEKAGCGEMPMGMPLSMPPAPVEGQEGEEAPAVVIRIPYGVKMASLTALNQVSAELVKMGGDQNLKTASEIDKIAQQIEKQAKTLENDKDESWMKGYFKAGELHGDADEKFMGEFNTDVSDEVKNALPAKGNTDVPYQKIK